MSATLLPPLGWAAQLAEARQHDAADSLAFLRQAYALPAQKPAQKFSHKKARQDKDFAEVGAPQHYFCGHSLGLMPQSVPDFLDELVQQWSQRAVAGHFEGSAPFMPYHECVAAPLAKLVGAKETEVVAMNSLTANLHFMMASFYRPQGGRCKIVIEASAFPSDRYAVAAQIQHHGFDPEACLIQIPAREADGLFDVDYFEQMLVGSAEEIALVLLPGVQYLTGEVLPIAKITQQVQAKGIPIGFDLAHGVGNIPLSLHNWGVDFAVWCHYKYMNAGPGAVAGCFVHQRHAQNRELPRLAGWWGHNKATRFQMPEVFDPIPTAEGWQVSNPPVFAIAPLRAALALFEQAGGMDPLRAKARALTTYCRQLLAGLSPDYLRIITPEAEDRSGSQLSLVCVAPNFSLSSESGGMAKGVSAGQRLMATLADAGVVVDWREPNVIRAGFIPSYTRFEDVWVFAKALYMALVPQEELLQAVE
jgi:kynureninase